MQLELDVGKPLLYGYYDGTDGTDGSGVAIIGVPGIVITGDHGVPSINGVVLSLSDLLFYSLPM